MDFTNFSIPTSDYLRSIEKYLKERYGKMEDSWYQLLEMLGGQLDIYALAKDEIKRNGLMIMGPRGMQSNPCIKIQNDALIQSQKLIQELGVSPKMEIKLKVTEPQANEEDFIEGLMN